VAVKGNKAEAARILGISRKNLYERLARMEKQG
jgi:DNA-binding NtrC family response regulator